MEIAHDQFREILTRLPEAGKPLHDALTRIVDCRVAEESWTGYTVSLAVAYSAAEGYTLAALRRLTEITSFFEEGVRISGVNWKAAEDASTVKAV
ncbi:hypothetical protein EJK15_55540 [Nonomuraea basaltis]|nr:hypothetical protein EJK15_55540 [Nonomuraea basaltis]